MLPWTEQTIGRKRPAWQDYILSGHKARPTVFGKFPNLVRCSPVVLAALTSPRIELRWSIAGLGFIASTPWES
jgi:hypothetical protein